LDGRNRKSPCMEEMNRVGGEPEREVETSGALSEGGSRVAFRTRRLEASWLS
jgi:hypothetical protein